MGDTKLITKEALDAMHLARQSGRSVKIPVVTYLIDSLQMFQFQGTAMVLIAFENHSVRMFESSNGYF